MIKIKDLYLEFPGRLQLKINHFEIPEGTLFGFIGPNGSGKSTLLNILSLFQKPDKGYVEVFGKNILSLKNPLPYRRRLSFVLSQPYLLKDTVYNNVRLPLVFRGISDNARVKEMLELFKITHLLKHKALSLSQGEMDRVCLARALVTQPELLLLDEPFSSLDQQYKYSLLQELRNIIKANKITTILVTQDQNEALFLADIIGVIKGGRILQTGKPQNVFTQPVSKEVADFIGIEAIAEGLIIDKEGSLCFVKVNDRVIEVVSEYDIGSNVFVCIRPENIVISRQLTLTSERNHFKAVITSIEAIRLEYKVNLECGFNLVAFVTRRSIENLNLKPGEDVFVSFKATAVHLIKR
ncbi:MAG: ABC transporter ATP-binding protein [bacterium]